MLSELTKHPGILSRSWTFLAGTRVREECVGAGIIVLGITVGNLCLPNSGSAWMTNKAVMAQAKKSFVVTHFFTGADQQSHGEDTELDFTATKLPLQPLSGVVELHRGAAGSVVDWHPAPHRQYVITLSGNGEIEFAGGQKAPVYPGHVEFIEDTVGKGHITRVLGAEDRISLWLPFADQTVLPNNRNK